MAKAKKPAGDAKSRRKPAADVVDAEIVGEIPAIKVEGDTVVADAPQDTDGSGETDADVAAEAEAEAPDAEPEARADEEVAPEPSDASDEEAAKEPSDVPDEQAATEPSDAPDEEVASEPPTETREAPEAERLVSDAKPRGAFLPLLLGGVVAGAIGFGAALILFPGGLGGNAEAEAFAAETRAALKAQSGDIAALRQQIAAMPAKADVDAALAVLQSDLDTLSARADAIGDTVGGFDARIIELEKRPLSDAVSPAAIRAYEREVEELREAVAAQRSEAAEMEANAQMTARQALARSALARISTALDSGQPYRAALTDLQSVTGVEVPAALEGAADKGVPTRTALEDAFPEAARAALAAARRSDEQADGGSRISTFLRNQLGARSVEPREGSDADAVLSRSEAALREGRLADALRELDLLSDTARAEMNGWTDLAKVRLDALQAVDVVSRSLTTN